MKRDSLKEVIVAIWILAVVSVIMAMMGCESTSTEKVAPLQVGDCAGLPVDIVDGKSYGLVYKVVAADDWKVAVVLVYADGTISSSPNVIARHYLQIVPCKE